MKIINIGKIPPPKGGISVFLKRLKPYLDEEGIINELYDISGINDNKKQLDGVFCYSTVVTFIKLFFQKKACVFFHSDRTLVMLGALFLKLRHETGIFVHSENILVNKNIFFHFLLKKLDHIVTPTIPIKNELLRQYPSLSNRIVCIPYVIFPKVIDDIKQPAIINLKLQTTHLIVGYAYDLTFYNEEDLYGVDMMVELIYKLRKSGLDVSMVLLLLNHTNEEYYDYIIKKIKKYNIDKYIYIMEEDLDEASSLFKIADVYVRPTNTDGNAFSIWESLYVKTPVVASDVSERPKDCIIFKNRNFEDFYLKTKNILQDLPKMKMILNDSKIEGNEKVLIDYFKKII